MNTQRKGNTAVLERDSGAAGQRTGGKAMPPRGNGPRHAKPVPDARNASGTGNSGSARPRRPGDADSRPKVTAARPGYSRPESRREPARVSRQMPPSRPVQAPQPQGWARRDGAAGGYVPPQWKNRPQNYTIPPVREPSSADALRQQNPANRRMEMRTAQRQNTEQLRRRNRQMQFRVETRRKPLSFKTVFRMCFLTLILYAIAMALILAFFAGNLILHAAKNNDTIVLQYGESTSQTMVKQYRTYGSVFVGGEMYLNMTDIAAMCELTTTGDMKEIRYMTRTAPQDIVSMTAGSTTVVINGESVALAVPVLVIDEKVYVPAALIEYYTSGVTVTYNDKKGKVTVVRNGAKTLSGDMSYDPFVFTLKAQSISDAIDLNSVPADIRNEIEGSHGGDEKDGTPSGGVNP